MEIEPLPALDDNYIYALIANGDAAVVDPGTPAPVEALLRRRSLRLQTILLTHAHGDHIMGAAPLRAQTGCSVVGPAGSGIPGLDREMRDGERIAVPGGELLALATPGHLAVHLSYYSAAQAALFCGDTLFGAGCGRIIQSNAATLWQSLQKLRALPPATRIYCGHEYTIDNLEFAQHEEPKNAAIAERLDQARACRERGAPTVPSTLAEEMRTNLFLRAESLAAFAALRARKDQW
ncbi:MAG: hydroxyacylglutathione hydrolase [Verrucomicrobia bacterium]|nr:hydroxyacylglutathione hydrolase [Verrucomicrobiota bacterium]